MFRSMDFQDSNFDGIDDRDQGNNQGLSDTPPPGFAY